MTLHQAILNILESRVGKQRRIGRKDLRYAIGSELWRKVSDREMRNAIEELRRSDPKGALICSSSGVGGYWIAEDFEELLLNYQEERRRAINTMVTIRNRLRRGRIHFDGQLNLF